MPSGGIRDRVVEETPICVLDLETTGLTAGGDRVVELSLVRIAPGQEPKLILDTLVNPRRHVTATEIHGITDADVADAPTFPMIAGDLVRTMAGSVVAAYNVYFDMRFLEFELGAVGIAQQPPHFCLMYMRPMLGLGNRCPLGDACRCHNLNLADAHKSGADALASAQLMAIYLVEMKRKGIRTFGDVASLKSYKFLESFEYAPFTSDLAKDIPPCNRRKPRSMRSAADTLPSTATAAAIPHNPLVDYWESLKVVLADLEITSDEVTALVEKKKQLGLSDEAVQALHAKAFLGILSRFSQDARIDDRESQVLRRLYQCLSRLGWAPGQ